MADTVVVKQIIDGGIKAVYVLSNRSDGTGEAAVTKIDISSLQLVPTKVKITKVKWAVVGMNVDILFDHDTDDRVLILNGNGELTEADLHGGIKDPASTGGPGDILLTTTGHTSGDGYTIQIEVMADGS